MTSAQVKALAKKIEQEISSSVLAYNQNLREDVEEIVREEFEEILEYKKAWKEDFWSDIMECDRRIKEVMVQGYMRNEGKKFKSSPYWESIVNDILVGTIECENLDALIQSIKSKYV